MRFILGQLLKYAYGDRIPHTPLCSNCNFTNADSDDTLEERYVKPFLDENDDIYTIIWNEHYLQQKSFKTIASESSISVKKLYDANKNFANAIVSKIFPDQKEPFECNDFDDMIIACRQKYFDMIDFYAGELSKNIQKYNMSVEVIEEQVPVEEIEAKEDCIIITKCAHFRVLRYSSDVLKRRFIISPSMLFDGLFWGQPLEDAISFASGKQCSIPLFKENENEIRPNYF